MQRDLNLPVAIKTDGKDVDVVHKTIMRKKNFTTPNPVVKYESVDQSFETFLESSDKNQKAIEESRKIWLSNRSITRGIQSRYQIF